MTLVINEPINGFILATASRIHIGDRDAVIHYYQSSGKYGFIVYWGERVFIQEPVYMTDAKALSDAILTVKEWNT